MAQPRDTTVIRDTEIENTLKKWADPIFRAANLDPSGVKIVLIQSPDVNAFVAGGANIFIYTGLIELTESPGELIGVIAHEVGHIAGGHLIKTRDALERASYESMLGTLLGIGAAIATGDGGAFPALSLGSNSIAMRRFLAHSRLQESSADQAALTFLEKAGIDPTGIENFLDKLKSQALMPVDQQSEYIQTHPILENRMEALQTRIDASPYKGKGYPDSWKNEHALMKAKLIAFINPGQIPWVYDDRDTSLPAAYARTIAAYRNNQVEESLKQVDALLARQPENPYFLELKGQMLLEYGRPEEALSSYRKSLAILPDAPLIRAALGHALIESKASNPAQEREWLNEAIDDLERVLNEEPRYALAHRLLATAYGREGNTGMAKIHLAEEAILQQKFDYARQQAEGVLNSSPKESKEWLKAKDVLSYLDTHEKG
ncbi:MAG: M48 family metallopeptidase [Alphaproteobacteria bacterium]|nr:M48 family metallopeptidase [Alphaproteobacteria bacterium]MCB1839566.1 M48 family metallopeptidase [Alphaproteobacteria bacterium]